MARKASCLSTEWALLDIDLHDTLCIFSAEEQSGMPKKSWMSFQFG